MPFFETAETDGIRLVILPVGNLKNDGPHVAVRAEGETAQLSVELGDEGGRFTRALIPCGRQDGWFLFRFDIELLERGTMINLTDEERILHTFLFADWIWIEQSRFVRNFVFHFTAFDADGNTAADAVKVY